jgi:hypothetical protein
VRCDYTVGTVATDLGDSQFIEVKRTSRLGTQVVRINADLLHFHSTPSALESSIGGVALIGSKVTAQASATNATMSKGRFIAVIPISGACRLGLGGTFLCD